MRSRLLILAQSRPSPRSRFPKAAQVQRLPQRRETLWGRSHLKLIFTLAQLLGQNQQMQSKWLSNAFLVVVVVGMVAKVQQELHCLVVLVEGQEDIAELQSTHPNLPKQVTQ
jgi:hypothetical protein